MEKSLSFKRLAVLLGFVAPLALVLTACRAPRESGTAGEEQTAAAASAQDTAASVPAYDPDTLAWVREGRPVVFDDRQWIVASTPARGVPTTRVGEFEGMALYTLPDQTIPYDRLFFPVTGGRWQMLVPTGPWPPDSLTEQADTSAGG